LVVLGDSLGVTAAMPDEQQSIGVFFRHRRNLLDET
jgi:hypothetical protein